MGIRFLLVRRCIVVALFAIATSTANAKADAPVKSWKVTGRVVDEAGKPVAGAEVFTNSLRYLPSAQQSSTKTDGDGRFVLEIAHRANGRLVRAASDEGRKQAAKNLPYELQEGVN